MDMLTDKHYWQKNAEWLCGKKYLLPTMLEWLRLATLSVVIWVVHGEESRMSRINMHLLHYWSFLLSKVTYKLWGENLWESSRRLMIKISYHILHFSESFHSFWFYFLSSFFLSAWRNSASALCAVLTVVLNLLLKQRPEFGLRFFQNCRESLKEDCNWSLWSSEDILLDLFNQMRQQSTDFNAQCSI